MLRTCVSVLARKSYLAAVAALCLVAPARAATVSGGTEEIEATAATNDVFGKVDGWFGGNLFSQGPQTVQYTLLGYEAGYINAFTVGSTLVFTGGGGFSTSQIVSPLIFSANGVVNFSFSANGGVSSVFDGSNVSLATLSNPATPPGLPNFFIWLLISRAIWVRPAAIPELSLWTMAAGAFTQTPTTTTWSSSPSLLRRSLNPRPGR